MDTETDLDACWAGLLEKLFPDLERSARDWRALVRCRKIRCAADLLRVCLVYGFCDKSLRETAAWAKLSGLADVSNVDVMNRVEKCADWLGHLVVSFMAAHGLPTPVPLPVRVVDATVLCKPGSQGTDYRVHVGIDLDTLRLTSVEVTGAEAGETFTRHSFAPGEVALGDRGYAHRPGVASVLAQDAHVVVRINWQNFPLQNPDGTPFDILEHVRQVKSRKVGDWPVVFTHNRKSYPVRFVVTKLNRKAIVEAQKHVRKEAKATPDPRSLEAAKYLMVITDLSPSILPSREAIELYRLRWAVESYFKRLKTILHADKLRAKGDKLARSYIYANILAALIIDELGIELGFFPQGCCSD